MAVNNEAVMVCFVFPSQNLSAVTDENRVENVHKTAPRGVNPFRFLPNTNRSVEQNPSGDADTCSDGHYTPNFL
jgi:hypothetical protein